MRPVITYLHTCSVEATLLLTAYFILLGYDMVNTNISKGRTASFFRGECTFSPSISLGGFITTSLQCVPLHFAYISKCPQRHSVEFPGCELCRVLRPHDDHWQKFLDSHRVIVPVAVEGSVIYGEALGNE